jgi:hypothetical protein
MGNKETKSAPALSMDEAFMEMRMTSKRFEMESRRAEKDKAKEMAKAQKVCKSSLSDNR